VNKIYMQIIAKIGGSPWGISELPLTDKPTMVVGYDVFHKRGLKSNLAMCSSFNKGLSRFFS
jgi:aubergine-like protein